MILRDIKSAAGQKDDYISSLVLCSVDTAMSESDRVDVPRVAIHPACRVVTRRASMIRQSIKTGEKDTFQPHGTCRAVRLSKCTIQNVYNIQGIEHVQLKLVSTIEASYCIAASFHCDRVAEAQHKAARQGGIISFNACLLHLCTA